MNKNKFNQQITDLTQKRQLFVVLIFFFVVIFLWTFSSIISSQQKIAISNDLINVASPLNPLLNQTIIEKLEEKRYFSDQELEQFSIYKIVSSSDKKVSKLVEINSGIESLTDSNKVNNENDSFSTTSVPNGKEQIINSNSEAENLPPSPTVVPILNQAGGQDI